MAKSDRQRAVDEAVARQKQKAAVKRGRAQAAADKKAVAKGRAAKVEIRNAVTSSWAKRMLGR
jgi:hypothetical protein